MILIVGNSSDQVPSVVNAVRDRTEEEVVIFKADRCLDGELLQYSNRNQSNVLEIIVDDDTIALDDVSAVWYWKPMLPGALRRQESEKEALFVYRQFLAMWRSIAHVCENARWVNDYYAVQQAEIKIAQLCVASRLGFTVPNTLITSCPNEVIEFWQRERGRVVMKLLSVSPVDNQAIFTTKVTRDVIAQIQRVRSAPTIFQAEVNKKFELRITVVGKSVFAAKVVHQDSLGKVDWRRGVTRFEEYRLPEKIEERCLKLCKELGLAYGCIDIIVTGSDEYVFLEINPNGQWEFVEHYSGMQIGAAIADLLLGGS